MADYHPLIARAVSGLEKNSGENRRALYERARIALVAQLRGVVPALEESEITRERLSLEEAIRKVEAEAARQARETARPAVPRRTESPRARATAPGADAPRSRRGTLATPRPVRSPEAPPAGKPLRRAAASGGRHPAELAGRGAEGFRDGPDPSDAPAEPRRPPPREHDREPPRDRYPRSRICRRAQPSPPERHPLEEYGQLEPQVQPENLWALPLDGAQAEAPVDLDAHQPAAQRHRPATRPDEPYAAAAAAVVRQDDPDRARADAHARGRLALVWQRPTSSASPAA